jgi:anti-anti-sigma factor
MSDPLAPFEAAVDDHGRLVITVRGDLDLLTTPGLRDLADAELASFTAESDEIVIDLSEVSFLDSTGIAVLVHAHRHAETIGRHLVVRAPSAAAQRVLDAGHLEVLLDITDH